MSEHHICNHNEGLTSVCQSLDEMEFERGIWSAALEGDDNRVKKLLDKGVSADVYDAGGYTALHYAARSGHSSTCELLISAGANVNGTTRAGNATALHRATSNGKERTVCILLKHDADPTLQDSDGRTCLHRAVMTGNENIVKSLLKASSELRNIKDLKDKLPRDYVTEKSNLLSILDE